jgi:hypothetical protein
LGRLCESLDILYNTHKQNKWPLDNTKCKSLVDWLKQPIILDLNKSSYAEFIITTINDKKNILLEDVKDPGAKPIGNIIPFKQSQKNKCISVINKLLKIKYSGGMRIILKEIVKTYGVSVLYGILVTFIIICVILIIFYYTYVYLKKDYPQLNVFSKYFPSKLKSTKNV